MRLFALILCFVLIQSCTPDYSIPEQAKEKEWIYLEEEGVSLEANLNFFYGDIITINDDSLARLRYFPYVDGTNYFSLETKNDSIHQALRFELVNDSTLVLKNYLHDNLTNEFLFRAFEPGTNGADMLNQLTGKSIRLKIDTTVHQIRMEKNPKPALSRDHFFVELESSVPDQLRNESYKKRDYPQIMRHAFVRVVINPHFPTFLFLSYGSPKPTSMPYLMLTDILEDGSLEFRYVNPEKPEHFQRIVGEILPNERTGHLSEDEMFYLLSQGDISIDDNPDFVPETDIDYTDKESFDKRGLDIKDLKDVGFSFNQDGTYDIFHKSRALSSGKFRLSSDRAYLILQERDYPRTYPLYSNGPGNLAFRYTFQLSTPKPLGERMFSFYSLQTVVSFDEPKANTQ